MEYYLRKDNDFYMFWHYDDDDGVDENVVNGPMTITMMKDGHIVMKKEMARVEARAFYRNLMNKGWKRWAPQKARCR